MRGKKQKKVLPGAEVRVSEIVSPMHALVIWRQPLRQEGGRWSPRCQLMSERLFGRHNCVSGRSCSVIQGQSIIQPMIQSSPCFIVSVARAMGSDTGLQRTKKAV